MHLPPEEKERERVGERQTETDTHEATGCGKDRRTDFLTDKKTLSLEPESWKNFLRDFSHFSYKTDIEPTHTYKIDFGCFVFFQFIAGKGGKKETIWCPLHAPELICHSPPRFFIFLSLSFFLHVLTVTFARLYHGFGQWVRFLPPIIKCSPRWRFRPSSSLSSFQPGPHNTGSLSTSW